MNLNNVAIAVGTFGNTTSLLGTWYTKGPAQTTDNFVGLELQSSGDAICNLSSNEPTLTNSGTSYSARLTKL